MTTWTDQEVEILKKHYSVNPANVHEAARELKRSIRSIDNKASKLGLRAKRSHITDCACGSTHDIKLISGEKICKRCRDLHNKSDYHRHETAHHETVIEPFSVNYVKIKDL